MRFKNKIHYLILGVLLMCTSCASFCSSYGLKEIKTPNGNIYIKREMRGLSFDSVVVSENSNYCIQPNKDSEFVFNTSGEKYYFLDSDRLYLLISYRDEYLKKITPANSNFPFPTEIIDLKSEKGRTIMTENKKDIVSLDIPVEDKIRCWFYWF